MMPPPRLSSRMTPLPSLSNQNKNGFQSDIDSIDSTVLAAQIIELENKLPKEQIILQKRKQQLDTCQEIAEGIITRLDAIEVKAVGKDTVIQPLHRAAQNLLRINENVEKTLELVEFVIKQGEVAQTEERVISGEPTMETLPIYLDSLRHVNEAIKGMQERHVEFINYIMDNLNNLRSKAQRTLVERYQEWVKVENPDQDFLKQVIAIVKEDFLWVEHARVRSRLVIALLDTAIKDAKTSEDNLLALIDAYKVQVEREKRLVNAIFDIKTQEILDAVLQPSRDAVIERFKVLGDKLITSYKRADFNYSILVMNLFPRIDVNFDAALYPAYTALKRILAQFFQELLNDVKATQVKPAFVNPTLKTASHESIGLKLTALTTFATHLQPSAPTVSDRYALAANANIFDQTNKIMSCLKHIVTDSNVAIDLLGGDASSLKSFIAELLRNTEASIDVNARQYKSPVASLIFQLNCIQYMWIGIKTLDPSVTDPAIEPHLQTSITALIKSLLTKWRSIAMLLSSDADQAPKTHALPSRDKLRQFQAAFDEACETQKHLIIVDAELLNSIHHQIRELILKEFISFYNLNQTLFGAKATSQLDPERVEQAINHLFESQ